jgi:hypothetical protein
MVALTALVSIATAIMLWPLVLQALAFRAQSAGGPTRINCEIGELTPRRCAWSTRAGERAPARPSSRRPTSACASKEERRHAEERLAAGEQRYRQVGADPRGAVDHRDGDRAANNAVAQMPAGGPEQVSAVPPWTSSTRATASAPSAPRSW